MTLGTSIATRFRFIFSAYMLRTLVWCAYHRREGSPLWWTATSLCSRTGRGLTLVCAPTDESYRQGVVRPYARLVHRRDSNNVVSDEGFVVTIAGALIQGSARDTLNAVHDFGLSTGSTNLYVRQNMFTIGPPLPGATLH